MRALAIYVTLFIFLYGSFFLVEAGVSDIQGNNSEYRALNLSVEDRVINIIFADDLYEIDIDNIFYHISHFIKSNLTERFN